MNMFWGIVAITFDALSELWISVRAFLIGHRVASHTCEDEPNAGCDGCLETLIRYGDRIGAGR